MSGDVASVTSSAVPPPPPGLPGFETVVRFWDPRLGRHLAKIGPGQYYLSRGGELITTVLGSCIAACVWDPHIGVGGMNHFMLPLGGGCATGGGTSRYGNFAMEHLVTGLLELGGARARLEVKLFGGARLGGAAVDVGPRNVAFVLGFTNREGLRVTGQDLGGSEGRRLLYDPATGRALVQRLRGLAADGVRRVEQAYASELRDAPPGGDVELC